MASPQPNPTPGPVVITDGEANAYLRIHGPEFLPAGVREPRIRISPERILGEADVDFDEVGRVGAETDDWGARFLAFVFRGKQHVTATGKLETGDGQGQLSVESLTVGTTSIPPAFVNFLLQQYVERRYNLDLSKPFNLPPQVTHIELGQGRATFHRSNANIR